MPTSTRAAPASPTTTRPRTTMRSRSPARSSATSATRHHPVGACDTGGAGCRSGRPVRRRARGLQTRARPARGDRAHRRRHRFPSSRHSTATRSSAASRGSRAFRSASSQTAASCSPSRRRRAPTSSSSRASDGPARLPAEHHRLHGRQGVRGRRHRTGRRQARHRGRMRGRAEVHRRHRRLVRRRQLRHVRPRLRAATALDVAERTHLGDGRRAGGDGADASSATRTRTRSARRTSTRAAPTSRPRGFGTTASSTHSTRAGCSPWALPPQPMHPSPRRHSASSACDVPACLAGSPAGHRPSRRRSNGIHRGRRERDRARLGRLPPGAPRARATAFGINQIDFGPDHVGAEHDEVESGQEEIYAVSPAAA